MTSYRIKNPEKEELGVRVTCEEHGESEEFEPGRRKVAFYCRMCGYELEITLRDTTDWRDLGERC